MPEDVKDIMKGMRDQGRTILFISHNMDIIRELSDHLIVLDSGRLLVEGEVEEITVPAGGHRGIPGGLAATRTGRCRQDRR